MAVSEYKCVCTGFESNSVAAEFQSAQAGVTIQAITVLSGTYSLKLDTFTAADDSYVYAHPEQASPGYSGALCESAYFKLQVDGTAAAGATYGKIIQFGFVFVEITAARKIKITNNSAQTATSTTALTVNVAAEIAILVAVNDKIYLRINGTDECNVPMPGGQVAPIISGGANNSGKGAVGGGFYTYIDDLIYLYTNVAGAQTPWITNGQLVKNALPGAEGNYADSTVTGVAHPNAYQNVDDYNNTADYNTLGSNSVVKRDTYKDNAAITLTNTNFNGFTAHVKTVLNNVPLNGRILIRDNAVDISSGGNITVGASAFGYYLMRPSDDTVSLTKAMLENTSGNNIEYGLYVPVQSGGTMTFDVISEWVTYIDGAAFTTVAFTNPPSSGRRRWAQVI